MPRTSGFFLAGFRDYPAVLCAGFGIIPWSRDNTGNFAPAQTSNDTAQNTCIPFPRQGKSIYIYTWYPVPASFARYFGRLNWSKPVIPQPVRSGIQVFFYGTKLLAIRTGSFFFFFFLQAGNGATHAAIYRCGRERSPRMALNGSDK